MAKKATKKYSTDFFIKKFTKIAEKRWITDTFGDGHGAHCALGHCVDSKGHNHQMRNDLCELFSGVLGVKVSSINDFNKPLAIKSSVGNVMIKEATPRRRILAALAFIKMVQRLKGRVELAEFVFKK